MSPVPKYLYQIEDHADCLWNVRIERQTAHGWPLLLGRRTNPGDGEKNCLSGDTVIITHELAAYLEIMRMTPGQINLPVERSVISRLRRVLKHNFLVDRRKWWNKRRYEMTATQKDIMDAYSVCARTVRQQSMKLGIAHGPPRWSETEKTQLRQFVEAGLSAKEIAKRIGKSPNGVETMRHRLIGSNSTIQLWTEAEKVEALRLLACGVKAQEIADRLGKTKHSIFAMRGRVVGAITPSKAPWSKKEKKQLIRLVEAGYRDQHIAEMLGRSRFAVRNMRQRLYGA